MENHRAFRLQECLFPIRCLSVAGRLPTKSQLRGALAAGLVFGVTGLAHAVAIVGQGTWETTLQARDLDGSRATAEAYYDTVLDITWLADASYAQTSGYDADGHMSWSAANAWAAVLDFNGIAGWRLPTVADTGSPGCDFALTGTDCGYNVDASTSEMASLFYDTLGNLSFYDTSGNPQPGWGMTNTGPFANLRGGLTEYDAYWSAAEYATDDFQAWRFLFTSGNQSHRDKYNEFNAWAVHSGDVGVAVVGVPEPGTLLLIGGGLLGLFGTRKSQTFRSLRAILDY